ncbi:hypothetical protein JOM56_010193 [Amanita muscaria]
MTSIGADLLPPPSSLGMPAKPVVRVSSAPYGQFSGLIVDPLEDDTTPPTPATIPVSSVSQMTPLEYSQLCIKTIFEKKNPDFDKAQCLYSLFIEVASELETTSHFMAVTTRIAENLATLGCKTKPCTLHCDKSHSEPCTLQHAIPCNLPHAEPCTLSHAEPAEPCPLPHFFVTPDLCTLSHAEPCTLLHIEPCTLSHAEPCTLSHADPCTLTHAEPCTRNHAEPCALNHFPVTRNHAEPCALNHFPVEPERIAIPIPCPLAHNDLCTREHTPQSPTSTPMDVVTPDDPVSPLPIVAPPLLTNNQIERKQLKRKKFKHRKIVTKLTKNHENAVLCRSQYNSEYEIDSDGFCRDPLHAQEYAHIKRELYDEDDENYANTMRSLMDLANDSDFLADKTPSQDGPRYIVYPSTNKNTGAQPLPIATDVHPPVVNIAIPPSSSSPPVGAIRNAPSSASPTAPLINVIPPSPTAAHTESQPSPKVVLPRAKSAPLPLTDNVKHTLPTRAFSAPPELSRNTITARRCTTQGPNTSSFVKFMDVPVTLSRQDITKSLKLNLRWNNVDISGMDIFAIKNKDSTITNVLKVKFKDDIQSNTKMPTLVSFHKVPIIEDSQLTTSQQIEDSRLTTSQQYATNIGPNIVQTSLQHRTNIVSTSFQHRFNIGLHAYALLHHDTSYSFTIIIAYGIFS